ncbi:hypothetical protein ACJJIU_10110 [Microbulbifer sp. CnH-101-E]|uniref:hypothetical protein n=1 Tax=unclassified Microbulbifer TaxID=2619833 RepID=UPI0040396EBC
MADSQLISKIDHSHCALQPAHVQQLRNLQFLNLARQRILEWPDSPVKKRRTQCPLWRRERGAGWIDLCSRTSSWWAEY